MSVSSTIRDIINETAWQQARDAQALRESSYAEGADRNVGGTMGKNDFLMLLSAQLRHQDPLNPQSDSEFAAQLAQFSALEQMQNMNETLNYMAGYQAYSLVGKYVIATAMVDGVLSEIPGMVDSVFTKGGTAFAQIGEYIVPISAITEVFDSSSMLTPNTLIQTSNSLIGRTVMALVGETLYEGIVTRVTVDRGVMYALLDDGSGTPKYVRVGDIFDIREAGTPGIITPPQEPPVEIEPPDRPNLIKDGEGYIETNDEGTHLGRWDWSEAIKEWTATGFAIEDDEGNELGRWAWDAADGKWVFEEAQP